MGSQDDDPLGAFLPPPHRQRALDAGPAGCIVQIVLNDANAPPLEDPSAMPFGTAAALHLLQETIDGIGPLGRVDDRFSVFRAIFDAELTYVDAELRRAAAEGARPGTLAADHLVGAGGKRV